MLNPKQAVAQKGMVERLFGGEPPAPVVRPTPEDATAVTPAVNDAGEPALERRSYCILRGRIELPADLELTNRQGQRRLFPWSYYSGADLDHPGEVVLLFDGPEGSSRITISGKGLDGELLAGIKAHRVTWIRELDQLAAAAVAKQDPTEPVVTGIFIAGGNREWSRGERARSG